MLQVSCTALVNTHSIRVLNISVDLYNIAWNKPADQSSTYHWTKSASKAVDGVTSGAGNFSHTKVRSSQWWRVDLLAEYFVYNVILHNRGEGQSEYISITV